MKKRKSLILFGLGLLTLGGIGLGLAQKPVTYVVKAEDEVAEPEQFECSVVVADTKHGEVIVDKEAGHVGEIVTVTAKNDLFYLVKSVSVNGTALIESEETAGLFTFALVEGENKIVAEFVIDEELLGEMSVIMDQAMNKDWTHLFSVENVLRIVSFVLNGGILIAVARYFIKDKRLEKKVENKIEDTMKKVIPDVTKEVVLSTIKDFITPIFSEMKLDNEEMKNALTVFARCLALAQENTPEAKIAITQELSSLKLSDVELVTKIKSEIEEFMTKQNEKAAALLDRMESIEKANKEIVESATKDHPVEEPKVDSDDGTQI